MNLQQHKPVWTSEELKIVYENYYKMSYCEMAKLLPNRSFAAVKNKWKKVKYGK